MTSKLLELPHRIKLALCNYFEEWTNAKGYTEKTARSIRRHSVEFVHHVYKLSHDGDDTSRENECEDIRIVRSYFQGRWKRISVSENTRVFFILPHQTYAL